MRSLLCSSRSYAAANGKSIFLIFTVKLILLQIIWLILATFFIFGLHILDSRDWGLFHRLHYDLIDVSLPRLVKISNNI
ncbi:hypothetical protein LINGRAHAP2_LOCUS26902 [Linum grandiflorum]